MSAVSWNRLVVGLSDLWMLAQADAGAGGDPAAGGAAGRGTASPWQQFFPLIVIGVLFYFIVLRPQLRAQKEKQRKHDELMAGLKKNDKVVTIGGIIGTVAEVTSDRVTLKVDDGTRIRFTRSSIQGLYGDSKDGKDQDT